MCVGFWVGGLIFFYKFGVTKDILIYALINSIVSYTWYLLMKYFIDKYD